MLTNYGVIVKCGVWEHNQAAFLWRSTVGFSREITLSLLMVVPPLLLLFFSKKTILQQRVRRFFKTPHTPEITITRDVIQGS